MLNGTKNYCIRTGATININKFINKNNSSVDYNMIKDQNMIDKKKTNKDFMVSLVNDFI